MDETGEKIMMADKDLNKNSFKLIYGLKPVGALIISPPLIFVDDYVIAEMVGGDGNDILIFNYKTGNVITAELKTNNSELKDWIIGYKERISKNIIRVSLGKIDNSTGTAQIDVAAGKMISGSLVLTGKNK